MFVLLQGFDAHRKKGSPRTSALSNNPPLKTHNVALTFHAVCRILGDNFSGGSVKQSTSDRISFVSGICGVALYAALAAAARAFFPSSFNPADNWLSDLGNRLLSPAGSVYYRLAGILGGGALLAFFAALGPWARRQNLTAPVLLLLARMLGMIAAAAFVLTGVFSIDMMPFHRWFSLANFVSFGTAVALTGIAALRGARLPRWFAVTCLLTCGVDIVSGVFSETRWPEWALVALLILYVTAMSLFALTRARDASAAERRAAGAWRDAPTHPPAVGRH